MRTSWMLSRPIPPTARDRDRRLGALVLSRRAARAWLLAGLVVGLVLGLSSCGAGGGDDSATRSTTERSGTRSDPSATATAPTRPTRTSTATPTPTTAERPSSPTTPPVTSAAGTPAAAESQGSGAFGWTLLILLVVALAAGWLLLRSRRRSAWDDESAAVEHDTRTTTGTQLPSVLTAETAGERALSWPPLRAALSDLVRRWALLAERAPDDRSRTRSGQVRSLLQELVAAVDAENQAAGSRTGLAAPAAAGRPGRAGAVRSSCWRPATGAICGRGPLAARARRMTIH